ncbi:MAG: PD40 domain-containing protein [Spirochaetes bacterium]|nr:PD40 domain-containing protein [Spirochaetota bacterium]
MPAGTIYPSECVKEIDRDTGVTVWRLTSYRGNSNHLYFTNNCFYDRNTKIVFAGDRDDRSNYFSLDLKTFVITQLTDLPRMPYPYDYKLLEAYVDSVRNCCYYFAGQDLFRLDLMTLQTQVIYTMPAGFIHHIVSCAENGTYVYTSIYEDMSSRFAVDTQHGYVGFADIAKAKPVSRIMKINADGSGAACIHEETCWIAHVNVNPKNENELTFCHEGPWNLIDHRVWGMDTVSGRIWKIRECGKGDVIGHEYWYSDGVHLGYHGHGSGGRVMGRVRFDNTSDEPVSFPFNTGHIFSLNRDLIVGDGDRDGTYLRLWKWNGAAYEEPRALCIHASSWKSQNSHAHPRFSPDGKNVLFTSDRTGYDQVYLAEVPEDISVLPLLKTLSKL